MEDGAGPSTRLRDGVRAALPLVLGPVLFGLSFGVFAGTAGMGALAAVVMSATTFAGSAQFAAASVLENGGTVVAAIISAVLLNARYIGQSIAAASIFPGGRLRRFLESQMIVDESWALSGRSGRFEWAILVGAGLLLYVLWVSSTAIGTFVGDALGDPNDLGLDAAFAALFLALAAPYLRTRKALRAAVLGGAIALALLPFAPAGVPLVAASVACLLGLRR
ncbi:MAG: AzlC family ABC transporter permease [Actinobacteria bacterium]|nr:AzlC family ABC transporter permease [Actinomycetota bacterium]